ncbi:histidine kinase [Kitasatospora purpeofusca]|uniref:histidine kinase n=1 Tax=Kitasatospora purpeofusca TaxID=67352 RepID=UPI00224CA7F5|nr:histidine kinase [Kitasatospora purpeofusca]MCX4756825.1 histidine kinase [Kitasatospora purpeofusca]WSR35397.1 histidine kinase [Kitasatospora purpeofusca]
MNNQQRLLGRYAPGRHRTTETLLLLTVLVLAVEESLAQWHVHDLPWRPLRMAGAVLAPLSLLSARRHPVAAAVLPVLFSGLLNRAFPGLFSLYHLASTGRSGPALAAAVVLAGLGAVRADSLADWAGTTGSQLLVEAAVLSLGLWLHSRRILIRTLNAKVEALGRERELRAEQARSAERARIAREMHDVLAHRLSLLVLHAGVLRDRARAGTVADDPERLAHRLELLRSTAARSLDDLRDVLGALRADPPVPLGATRSAGSVEPDGDAGVLDCVRTDSGRGSAEASTGPGAEPGPAPTGAGAALLSAPVVPRPSVAAPALRDLAELVAEATASGQRVELALAGDPEAVPTTHRLAVHRVVQEALTNARKYAHTAPVTVRVRYGAPATTVEVCNGAGDPAPSGACTGGGYGLVGLGERVGALGGHFDAGPDGRGGFRLAARLPAPDRLPVRPPLDPPAPPPASPPVPPPVPPPGRCPAPAAARPRTGPNPPSEAT